MFANASITGKPAIVFTENNESDKSSVTSNRRPFAPSIENRVKFAALPEPTTDTLFAVFPDTVKVDPSNVKFVSALIVDELTDVITLLSATFVYEVIPALAPVAPVVP